MGRPKKNNSIQHEKKEVVMTENENMEVLEAPVQANDEALEMVQVEIDVARLELEKTKLEIEKRKHELNLMKVTPSREITPQEKELSEKQVTMTNEQVTLKQKIEKQKAIDSVMVTGRFMNRRAPGQPVKLPYIKYESDPVKWYPFDDGKVYTIPRGFADQLNGGTEDDPCYYTPQFIQRQGEMDPNKPESAIHAVDSSNKKYAFTPVNF
jgi:hypothetical protein